MSPHQERLRPLAELLGQAWSLHRAGRLPQAEQLYRRVLQDDPRHAQALHLLGILALQPDDFQAALTWLRDACAISPGADCLSNLSLAFRGLGRLAEAEAALREAVRLTPDAEIYNNLGTVLLELGRPVEAEAAWRETLRLKPDPPGLRSPTIGGSFSLSREPAP